MSEEEGDAVAVDADRLARKCLRISLLQNSIVDLVAPAHDPGRRDRILADTLHPLHCAVPPVSLIRSYYGEEVAFYFAWMGHFTHWLSLPAITGLLATYAWGYMSGDDEDSCRFSALHALVTPLWGVLAARL